MKQKSMNSSQPNLGSSQRNLNSSQPNLGSSHVNLEISQEIAAKALIDIAYSQQLINQETYLKIQRKYGDCSNDIYDDGRTEKVL